MTTMTAMTTSMAGMNMTGSTTTGAATGTTMPGMMMPNAPRSGDPRFVQGSVGELGQEETIKQKDGPAYLGFDVAKNQNDNDKKQQNYNVTDANFTRFLGVIADPDTGQPQSYAQTMQNYNAAGAIEKLYPEVYQKLIENQNAGRGTVLGGVLAIFGVSKSDGAGGASLSGIDDATISQIRNATIPGIGSLRDYAFDTRDAKGREWNRAHHPESHWSALTQLAGEGWNWDEAAVFTGDSMTSWAGRVLGTNNQDGDKTGFAADELAGLKYLVLTEQATGKSDILEKVIMSHNMTHLSPDQLTDPKINKLIGLPDDFRAQTKEDVAMVTGRIRQWALDPNVQVDEGEFNKFVKAGADTRSGQILAGSGLLNTVQFKPKEQNNGGGNEGGGGNNNNEDITPTGVGTGAAPVATTPIGSGASLQMDLPGSPTIGSRPLIEDLGNGGPFPVIDPKTGKLDRALQEQMMTAFIDVLMSMNDSPFLDDDKEKAAFEDGAKKGVQYLKDQVAVDPDAVDALKGELADAMADGKITDDERTSLAEKLNEAGMEDVAKSVEDGTATDEEIATIQEKVDGAASAKLEKDITSAMEDGKLSAEERASIEGRLGKDGLDALEAGIEDGTVTKEELQAIADGTKKDAEARKADGGAADAKAGADQTEEGAAATDAKAGADGAKGDDAP
ncbi:MAG: hypothetical protein KDC46_05915, partial [Thermoleophilia bacterium]|nr:hypothetical protein [Thermoleophilia bacterium]